MSETLGFRVERDGAVLVITFNRPDCGNAIPAEATAPLTEIFRNASSDSGIRALLIRGEGKRFSAGGDIAGFMRSLEGSKEARQEEFYARLNRGKALIESFIALSLPIVTACQGAVAGAGMIYALGADLVLADPTVFFVFAHQRIGLPPDGGVSVLLPRVVGERKARELVLTAAKVDADEALRLNLVSRLVPSMSLQDDALAAAHAFAAGPRKVICRAKHLFAGSMSRTPSSQLEAERDAVVASVGEVDFEEGVRAFVEKRMPRFEA